MTVVTSTSISVDDRYLAEGSYRCDHCSRLSVCQALSLTYFSHESSIDDFLDQHGSWQPRVGVKKEFLDVPPVIASAASEAHECASINARRGAVVLARAVIEATAKAKGILHGSLHDKINAMRKADLIRPDIAEAAHEVRLAGNDMAHGDLQNSPTDEDLEDLLVLMGQVLSEVFQGPALLASIKARRSSAT